MSDQKISEKERLALEYFKLFSKELDNDPVVEQGKRMEEIRKKLDLTQKEILEIAKVTIDKQL
jgi:hypothetical protein